MNQNAQNKILYYKNPQLNGGTIYHAGAEIGILLIHGFTATTVEVGKLAGHFISKGYTVSAPLLPGHGTSPYGLNKVKFHDWMSCVENALDSLTAQCSKVIICGESMGGVLSLYLAEQNLNIDGLFLFSTALLVKKLRYARFIKLFRPIIDKDMSEDGLPWQGYTVYPAFAADQFYRMTKIVRGNLHKVIVPTMLFQGRFDKSIDVGNIDYIFNNINSEIKKKVLMENSGHVLLLDKELDTIITSINNFIKNNQIF